MIRSIFAALVAATLVTAAAAQEGKLNIATVDMQELFKNYYRTAEAQKQINVERARIQKDNNERLGRIRELEENLGNLRKQLEDPSINESKKQSLFKEWQMQQQEGIALDRERREFLQRRNQALNEKMVQRMKGILEEIRKLALHQGRHRHHRRPPEGPQQGRSRGVASGPGRSEAGNPAAGRRSRR
jgi:outer membrane protein